MGTEDGKRNERSISTRLGRCVGTGKGIGVPCTGTG
jgi:hypothetical protein